MSNRYSRHQSAISRQSDEPISEDHWLKQFQKNLAKSGVQSRSVDSSLFDQINSIMNGKSKYPSVEAAVEDMKERSGLTAYLDKINKVSEIETNDNTKKISKAEDKAEDKPVEYFELKPDNDERNTNYHAWLEKVLDKFNKKKASDNNSVIDKTIPIVIKKFPAIKNTLNNCIKDTKGNLPISAIIDRIRSIHQGDVSDAKDWEDDNLTKLVSRLNLEAKKDNPDSFNNYSNLGLRDQDSDSNIDPSNTDAFHALNPVKY